MCWIYKNLQKILNCPLQSIKIMLLYDYEMWSRKEKGIMYISRYKNGDMFNEIAR